MPTLCIPGRMQSLSAPIGSDVAVSHRAADPSMHEGPALEALGLLTGGVAHDFGNLLSVLLGNAQLAQRLLAEPDAERLVMISDALLAIEQTVHTGKALVQHLFAIVTDPLPQRQGLLRRETEGVQPHSLNVQSGIEIAVDLQTTRRTVMHPHG